MRIDLLKEHKTVAVIGTDTEVGKTYVSVCLMNQFKKYGLTVAGLKPVASGGFIKNGGLVNEDALALQQSSSMELEYGMVNPNVYEPAIAPHIAAAWVKEHLSVRKLVAQTHKSLQKINSDIILIEGVGGLLTPLNEHETWADYLQALDFPVLLIVGIKLGCISHALLTAAYLDKHKISAIGWIANCITPDMPALEENIATLDAMLKLPRVAKVEFHQQ